MNSYLIRIQDALIIKQHPMLCNHAVLPTYSMLDIFKFNNLHKRQKDRFARIPAPLTWTRARLFWVWQYSMWGKELLVINVTIYNLILHLKVWYIIYCLLLSMLPAVESSILSAPTSTMVWRIQTRLDKLDQHRLNEVTPNFPPRFQVHVYWSSVNIRVTTETAPTLSFSSRWEFNITGDNENKDKQRWEKPLEVPLLFTQNINA